MEKWISKIRSAVKNKLGVGMVLSICPFCKIEFKNVQYNKGQRYCCRVCKKLDIKKRFLKFVNKTKTCWIWTGSKHNKGYGHFQIGKDSKKAHRVSYELFKGKIDKNLHVLHKCDNPPCVNPKHLFLGTNLDNSNDKISKNRHAKEYKIWKTKLSNQQVLEIRNKYIPMKYTAKMLAKEYNVTPGYIAVLVSNCKRRIL